MRIIVVSDTHGMMTPFRKVYETQLGADLFLFLGDGYAEVGFMRGEYPEIPLVAVRGNCDLACPEPNEKTLDCSGAKLLVTHGHTYGVKSSLAALKQRANEVCAQVALYGHTHIPAYEYDNGVHCFNPGSLGNPRRSRRATYGVIEITRAGIVCSHAEISN